MRNPCYGQMCPRETSAEALCRVGMFKVSRWGLPECPAVACGLDGLAGVFLEMQQKMGFGVVWTDHVRVLVKYVFLTH